MNENAAVFKPTDVVVTLNDQDYRLLYDLNAFCEMEKLYDSVDSVLQMLLGNTGAPDLAKVTYQGKEVDPNDIMIGVEFLTAYINKISQVKEAKHSDTLNLLWLGCLHDHTEYDEHGEIARYTIAKARLGSMITFKNLREVNGKILTALLRDLVPTEEVKNAEAPE